MDLRQLEMFRVVAETGGFTRAGDKLHVSHSAISRQIQLLEEELGAPLFVRATRRVHLTGAGKVLLPYVKTIFEQVVKATQSVAQLSHPSACRLTVGTGTTMLNFFLPPVLDKFRSNHPSVPVLIKTGHTYNLLEDIRTGALDLGIVSLPIRGPGLSIHPLYREELVIVVGKRHPLRLRKFVRAEEIQSLPLILFPPPSATRWLLDRFFAGSSITPLISMELENDEAVEKAVEGGLGVSFLPKQRAARDRFHFLRVSGHRLFRNVALVCNTPPPLHVSEFLNLCRERVKASPGSFQAPVLEDPVLIEGPLSEL
jgi:DNA-binding transcriptional LysR family regulator